MLVNGDLSISHASGVDYEANLALKDEVKVRVDVGEVSGESSGLIDAGARGRAEIAVLCDNRVNHGLC